MRLLLALWAAVACLRAVGAARGANASPVAAAASDSRELFAQHVQKFSLSLEAGSVEYESRHEVFRDNLAQIEAHNAKKDKSFTMGVNKFAHLTADEFAESLGYGKSYIKRKDVPLAATIEDGDAAAEAGGHVTAHPLSHRRAQTMLPESWDWSAKGATTPVKNQGSCGASWAFAATGALEGAYFAKYDRLPNASPASPDSGFIGLSEQQLLACEQINGGCFVGGAAQYGFMYAADNGGLASEVDVPYSSGSTPTDVGICDNFIVDPSTATVPDKPFVSVSPTVAAMMNAVYNQPVAITINAMNPAFQLYNFGTISDGSICPPGNAEHNALLVGWGADENDIPFWIIKNSWG